MAPLPGHFDHLVRSHNGPVTDILDRRCLPGAHHHLRQTHVHLNSVMMEMNMEHGGSTGGTEGRVSGMAKEDFLKSVRLVLILEADWDLARWRSIHRTSSQFLI